MYVWLLLLLFCLLGCAPTHYANVEDRKVYSVAEQTEKYGGSHVRYAQAGDTLYSIAFSAGLDVNKVAAWNGLHEKSKVRVGQRIRLTRPLSFVPAKKKVVRKISQVSSSIKKQPLKTRQPSQNQNQKDTSLSAKDVNQANVNITPNKIKWIWPVKDAEVVMRFSLAQNQQGIDIRQKKGHPVVAASGGEVVYVGNGLKGYGNLVIIKHNSEYLSAYAHNDETFVREGEFVKRNQRLGSVGFNGRGQVALHFQIRKNGNPVNPLLYLPR